MEFLVVAVTRTPEQERRSQAGGDRPRMFPLEFVLGLQGALPLSGRLGGEDHASEQRVEDVFLQKFMLGTFPGCLANQLVLKRRANQLEICALVLGSCLHTSSTSWWAAVRLCCPTFTNAPPVCTSRLCLPRLCEEYGSTNSTESTQNSAAQRKAKGQSTASRSRERATPRNQEDRPWELCSGQFAVCRSSGTRMPQCPWASWVRQNVHPDAALLEPVTSLLVPSSRRHPPTP
ncbi:uncharacterized protein LOC116598978 [Mustela erminea]|uniref:uncharacterized protein LOC116598978 n=1 Tax=Mustela erminea TaxID=36723 RepID=UPI0013870707|nr:uncharacterized protein LOC116598978 [Mustela erminea]